MEDVLDVYQRPYDPTLPVVCIDEKSKELRDTPAGSIPAEPGRPERIDYEYERNGTANIFLWTEPHTARTNVRVTKQRTACDFAEQLRRLVDVHYPDSERVALVCDNLNTHSPAALYERFEPAEARRIAQRLEWHYTPEHGSWLNIAEIELSVLSRQCLARRIADMDTLASEVAAWQQRNNSGSKKVNWHFTTADARTKLRRLYPQVTRL